MTVRILAVNEFVPAFSAAAYEFTVAETALDGYSLGVISATDRDNDELVYTLRNAGSGKGVLWVMHVADSDDFFPLSKAW